MRDKYDSEEEMEAKERWRQSEKYNDQQAELARQSPKEALSGREKIPFHECYILIEVDDDGEEHASFYSSPAARDKATLEALWFGGPDDGHKEEAEHYLSELREKGFLAFEGDPPLRWRTLSDYVKQSESAPAAARGEGRKTLFELSEWIRDERNAAIRSGNRDRVLTLTCALEKVMETARAAASRAGGGK